MTLAWSCVPTALLDPVQPPEAVQLDAFVDCQLSVTACPESIWVWLADTVTETFFAGLIVAVPAGLAAGALDALPGVELDGAAALAVVADVPPAAVAGVPRELVGAAALEVVVAGRLAAVLGVAVPVAGAAEPPEPPPPPHAA